MDGEKTLRVIYSYDELNRLTSAEYGEGRKMAYAYDPAGNLIRVIAEAPVPAGPPVAEATIPAPQREALPPPPPPPAPPPEAQPQEEVPIFERTVELLPLTLVVEEGRHKGKRFSLVKGGNLGRQEGNEIVLDDGNISRKHAAFTLGEEGVWYVTDLGSVNGTWVNGVEIKEPTTLKQDDLIQVGSTVLRFVIG